MPVTIRYFSDTSGSHECRRSLYVAKVRGLHAWPPDGLIDGVPHVARGEPQFLAGVLRGQGRLRQELLPDERVAQHPQGKAPRRLLRGVLHRPDTRRKGMKTTTRDYRTRGGEKYRIRESSDVGA